MKQKTAMQLAIEDVEDLFIDEPVGVMMLIRSQILKRLKSRLPTEREQIEEAYNQDLYGGLSGHQKFNDGADYYQQKYGDEPTIKND